MADGLLKPISSARVGHIGLYRDEHKRPVEPGVRLPEIEDRVFIVCDPMVGTGDSAAHAVDVLRRRGRWAVRNEVKCGISTPRGAR